MINATNIGKYFLLKNKELTEIQIQKLTYYAYAWYIVKHNNLKLFEEAPEAWMHGPVFRSLYHSMKKESFYKDEVEGDIEDDVRSFLDVIYQIYGKYSGNELENMTHSELPWQNARKKANVKPHERSTEKITDEDIITCYGN